MSDFKVTPLDSHIDFEQILYWDVVVIGAGPSGLAAALTTAHRGLTTLVIEAKDKPGGQSQFLYAEKRLSDLKISLIGEKIAQAAVEQKHSRKSK